jgi:hypothetical protein
MSMKGRSLVAMTGLLVLLAGCGKGCGKKAAEQAEGAATPAALAAAPLAAAGPALRDDPAPLPEGIKRGDTCTLPLWFSTPAVGTAPTVVTGDLAGFAGDFLPAEGSGVSPWGGRDAFYRIDLQAGDTYRFTLRAKSGTLGLFGVRGCASPEQGLLFSETAGKPVFFTATADGPIWLGVDAKGDYTAAGSFELEAFRLPPPGSSATGPEGAGTSGGSDLCDTAPLLVPGKRLQGNTQGATTQVTEPFKGSGLSWVGPDHFFTLAVKKGATYQLELDTLGQFAGGLYLLADCAQVAGSALAETAASSPLVWTSDRDGTVVVGVDSIERGVGGPYQLAALERPAK